MLHMLWPSTLLSQLICCVRIRIRVEWRCLTQLTLWDTPESGRSFDIDKYIKDYGVCLLPWVYALVLACWNYMYCMVELGSLSWASSSCCNNSLHLLVPFIVKNFNIIGVFIWHYLISDPYAILQLSGGNWGYYQKNGGRNGEVYLQGGL